MIKPNLMSTGILKLSTNYGLRQETVEPSSCLFLYNLQHSFSNNFKVPNFPSQFSAKKKKILHKFSLYIKKIQLNFQQFKKKGKKKWEKEKEKKNSLQKILFTLKEKYLKKKEKKRKGEYIRTISKCGEHLTWKFSPTNFNRFRKLWNPFEKCEFGYLMKLKKNFPSSKLSV